MCMCDTAGGGVCVCGGGGEGRGFDHFAKALLVPISSILACASTGHGCKIIKFSINTRIQLIQKPFFPSMVYVNIFYPLSPYTIYNV